MLAIKSKINNFFLPRTALIEKNNLKTFILAFESMSATLKQEHWGLHAGMPADKCDGTSCIGSNPMSQRNYPCDSLIEAYFGLAHPNELDQVGTSEFQKQLWQCMIAGALKVKSQIEILRAQNGFGLLVWQLNEV